MPSVKGKETMAGDKGSRISSGSSGEEFKDGNGPNSNGSVGNGAEAQNSDNMLTITSSNNNRTASRFAESHSRGQTPSGASEGPLILLESFKVISTSTNNIPESSATAMRRRSLSHSETTSRNRASRNSRQNIRTFLPARRSSMPEDTSIPNRNPCEDIRPRDRVQRRGNISTLNPFETNSVLSPLAGSTGSISTDALNEDSSISRLPVPGDPSSVNYNTPSDIELQNLSRRQPGESRRLSTAETVIGSISGPGRYGRLYSVIPCLCISAFLIGIFPVIIVKSLKSNLKYGDEKQ